DNSATDIDTLTPEADLSITKTDGATTAVPGDAVTYVIVVSNGGPSTVTGATVTDVLPADLTAATWNCTATPGSSCADAAGAGDVATTVDLLSGGTATITVDATVAADATGTLSNTATVALPTGATDPTPDNNSATDTDTLEPEADLSITKTDATASATPGGSTTYEIVVANAGPSAVVGAAVADV
ncbi:MAG: DUF11 domain-containing protein, partial [Xanthomonadales bacterium]|nr:DUF11 domain-containing protein [Xanthomonadales bacterium]